MMEQPSLPEHQQWLPNEQLRHFVSTTESAEYFSHLFVAHTLESLAPRSALNLYVRSRWFRGTGLLVLDFGVPVRISPEGLKNFFLIQIPLAGSAHLRVEDHEIVSTPRLASLPPAHQSSIITWQQASPHLLLYLPRAVVEACAQKLYGLESAAGIQLATSLPLDTVRGARFMQGLRMFHDDVLDHEPDVLITQASLELMVMRLLAAIDHSLATAPAPAVEPPQHSSDSLGHRYLSLLRQHATEDVTIADFAERLGVSVRTLQAATSHTFQRTPLQLIRMERLKMAHQLLSDPTQQSRSISDIAVECGFEHFGRFSTQYRQHFGESPSDTKYRSSP